MQHIVGLHTYSVQAKNCFYWPLMTDDRRSIIYVAKLVSSVKVSPAVSSFSDPLTPCWSVRLKSVTNF